MHVLVCAIHILYFTIFCSLCHVYWETCSYCQNTTDYSVMWNIFVLCHVHAGVCAVSTVNFTPPLLFASLHTLCFRILTLFTTPRLHSCRTLVITSARWYHQNQVLWICFISVAFPDVLFPICAFLLSCVCSHALYLCIYLSIYLSIYLAFSLSLIVSLFLLLLLLCLLDSCFLSIWL